MTGDIHGFWKALEIIAVCFWVLLLLIILYNGYHYLYKMQRFRFIPMVLVYVSMIVADLIVIAYFASPDHTVAGWVYYSCNLSLVAILAMLGYTCMLIELRLMLMVLL